MTKKTTTEPLKEGVATIFRVVYLYTDSIFCDNFILHCHIILFTGMKIIAKNLFALDEVRIPCRTATQAHFVALNKGA